MYTDNQLLNILEECGVYITSDSDGGIQALCPFHNNNNSSSFSMQKETGFYRCYNPSCNAGGTLEWFVKKTLDKSHFEALRIIANARDGEEVDISKHVNELLRNEEVQILPEEKIIALNNEYNSSERAVQYMWSRGLNKIICNKFQIGYNPNTDMIAVPLHMTDGSPVGIIGRSIEGKTFKNSAKMPRNKTCFNIHRAKKMSTTVVIVESSFDAMRIHNIGYAAIAILGGYISERQVELIGRYFDTVVIATDNDELQFHNDCKVCLKKDSEVCLGHNPGRELGGKIAKALSSKKVLWAAYSETVIYPGNSKDISDMPDFDIQSVIDRALTVPKYADLFPQY